VKTLGKAVYGWDNKDSSREKDGTIFKPRISFPSCRCVPNSSSGKGNAQSGKELRQRRVPMC
jgi:hypothetical protein